MQIYGRKKFIVYPPDQEPLPISVAGQAEPVAWSTASTRRTSTEVSVVREGDADDVRPRAGRAAVRSEPLVAYDEDADAVDHALDQHREPIELATRWSITSPCGADPVGVARQPAYLAGAGAWRAWRDRGWRQAVFRRLTQNQAHAVTCDSNTGVARFRFPRCSRECCSIISRNRIPASTSSSSSSICPKPIDPTRMEDGLALAGPAPRCSARAVRRGKVSISPSRSSSRVSSSRSSSKTCTPLVGAISTERLDAFLRRIDFAASILDSAPLLRLTLFQWGEASFSLVWTFHHALARRSLVPDPAARGVRGCTTSWRRVACRRRPEPPDYRRVHRWLRTRDFSIGRTFWKELLAGFSAPTPLVVDRHGRR